MRCSLPRVQVSYPELLLELDKSPLIADHTVVLVERVLGKMEGVESFDVSLEEQKVTVTGNVTKEDVFEKVSKTGKKTEFWPDA